MHQTISGETHNKKTIVLENKKIKNIFEKEKEIYYSFKNKKCLYESKTYIDNNVLNYLNNNILENKNNPVRSLIKHQFDVSEKIYPYLGDIFIESFFNKRTYKKSLNAFKFKKNMKNDFLKSIKDPVVTDIAKIYFENFSLKNVVSIEKYFEKDIKLIKEKNVTFNLEFDNDFYLNESKKIVDNYNIVLLNGYIQSISEIHHLLTDSSENKKNYILFCYGMSDDVKHNIINNNIQKRTFVYPICFSLSEENLNLLNDISMLHNNSIVVSAESGQTISQLFTNSSNQIKKGSKITISKNRFTIFCKDNKLINDHRKFLVERAEETKNEKNRLIILERLKRLTTNCIKIMIPDTMWRHNNFIRDLDYLLRFFSNCHKFFVKIKSPDKNNFYYCTLDSILSLEASIKSFSEKIEKLEKMIIFS